MQASEIATDTLLCMEWMLDYLNNFHIITLALKATTGMLLWRVTTDMPLRGRRNCRAPVRLPGLNCWGKTQVSVSSVEETLLMTYQTMGLITNVSSTGEIARDASVGV